MTWTDDRVDLLKKLWSDGLSASQIATRLGGGVTRNAVIGKVHRLGLSGRAKPQGQTQPARRPAPGAEERTQARPQILGNLSLKFQPAPAAAPAPVARPAPVLLVDQTEDAPRATILTLTEQTCKWPVGDPTSADFYFCGKRSELGQPYCLHHVRVAYQPAQDRRRDRSRERRIA